MKMKRILYAVILAFTFASCDENDNKSNPIGDTDPIDNPSFYDNDSNCGADKQSGNCCDVDGRILVRRGYSYTYTYYGNNNGNTTLSNIEWEVLSGDIILIEGQNTTHAKFKFGASFTTGKISAHGKVNGNICQSIIEVSKL